MPISKKQMRRLIMLASELKQNKYPNTKSFAEKLWNMDIDENENISCTSKTIQRDLKVLKEEYGAPIEYDSERRGYYLLHHGWCFHCPVFEEQDMVAAILGSHLAQEIFPDPLKSDFKNSTDNLLTENNPEFLDTATVDALIVASGLKVNIDSEIFKTVFEAWQLHKTLDLVYHSVADDVTERTIEPHVLVYQNSSWFIKARCLLRDEVRTFAVHRIKEAEINDSNFDLDTDIIEQVRNGQLFDYHKIKDIKIHCEQALRPYVIDKSLHSRQKIERHADGSFTVTIPDATEYDIISWVLAQAGKATLQTPKTIKSKIAKISAEITKKH